MVAAELFLRSLGRLAAFGGGKDRLTVILYHRVLSSADSLLPAEPDAALFDAQMGMLSRVFHILPLENALERLRKGTLPARALSITFDDGYRDNLEVAVPILQSHGLVATFFVATGFLNGGRMMHDTVIETVRRMPLRTLDLDWIGLGQRSIDDTASRLALIGDFVNRVKYMPFAQRRDACEQFGTLSPSSLPTDLMMTSAQVQLLQRAGMHVGGHTHDHPILAKSEPDEAWRQITRNRDELAGLLGAAPRLFAYPNGKPGLDYRSEHVEMVKKAGFDGAVSVAFGSTSVGLTPFQVPRFIPWDLKPEKLALRIIASPLRHRAVSHV